MSLRNEDEHVFDKIIAAHSFITADLLEIFYHIGTKALHPLAVLLPKHVFAEIRATGMSYEAQEKFLTEPVQVVTRLTGGEPVVVRKPLSKLTKDEARWALCRKGNRSVEKQVIKIKEPAKPAPDLLLPKKEPVKVVPRAPKPICNYVVRHTLGGYVFEKTKAAPYSLQRVILLEGKAVIELCGDPKGTAVIQLAEYK